MSRESSSTSFEKISGMNPNKGGLGLGTLKLSQINRNLSSNHLFHNIPNEKAKQKQSQNRVATFQLPLSPPLSNPTSPVKEHDYFISDAQESGVSSWMPPIDWKVVALCFNWYIFSIISNNSTKLILSNYNYPITLTELQFCINSILCILLVMGLIQFPKLDRYFPQGSVPKLSSIDNSILKFVQPDTQVIKTTLPMGGFQFIGHITSHKATSLIPVSLVHTIKALSPITTVFIYRIFFGKTYKKITYITLIPLMVGIMITCYKPSNSIQTLYMSGFIYAFISMLIFVNQNIFAKKKLTLKSTSDLPSYNTTNEEKKFDKLTILFFCSMIGFVLTLPIYIILEFNNESISILNLNKTMISLILLNGGSHFVQSLIAFQLLGLISPINYSIANILKRIIIILFSFLWENNKNLNPTQIFGLSLTFIGLYCYDRFGSAK